MASGLTGFRLIVYIPIEGYCLLAEKELADRMEYIFSRKTSNLFYYVQSVLHIYDFVFTTKEVSEKI